MTGSLKPLLSNIYMPLDINYSVLLESIRRNGWASTFLQFFYKYSVSFWPLSDAIGNSEYPFNNFIQSQVVRGSSTREEFGLAKIRVTNG